jgi:hypothetical protein
VLFDSIVVNGKNSSIKYDIEVIKDNAILNFYPTTSGYHEAFGEIKIIYFDDYGERDTFYKPFIREFVICE